MKVLTQSGMVKILRNESHRRVKRLLDFSMPSTVTEMKNKNENKSSRNLIPDEPL